MAFSGTGGGNKAASPFTVNANQVVPQPGGTNSYTFGTTATGSTGQSASPFNFTSGAGAGTGTFSAPQLSNTGTSGTAATTNSLFNFGTTAAPPISSVGGQPAFGFGTAPPPLATPGAVTVANPSSGAPAPVSGSAGIGGPAATSTAGVSAPTPPSAPATSGTSNAVPPNPGAVPATSSAAQPGLGAGSGAPAPLNFRQLQESVNKWMLELQEQETLFMEQATKVNARDRTLIVNGDKIGKLSEAMDKVKIDHGRMEHALDFLKTQQNELESFLKPLEANLNITLPVEPERQQLYSSAANLDIELQQMSADLKTVIEQINESNKTSNQNEPVVQILKILNEHTDALQMVEEKTNDIRRALEETSRQHQKAKLDHERTLRQMFK